MDRMQRLLSSSTEEEQQAAMLQLQVMLFSRDAFGPESIRQLTVSATLASCRSRCSAGTPSSNLGWSPSGSSFQMLQSAAPHQQAASGQTACVVPNRFLCRFMGAHHRGLVFGRATLPAANTLGSESTVSACIIAPLSDGPSSISCISNCLWLAQQPVQRFSCHATCRADRLCRAVRLRQPPGHDPWHCDSSIKTQSEQPGLCNPSLPACL